MTWLCSQGFKYLRFSSVIFTCSSMWKLDLNDWQLVNECHWYHAVKLTEWQTYKKRFLQEANALTWKIFLFDQKLQKPTISIRYIESPSYIFRSQFSIEMMLSALSVHFSAGKMFKSSLPNFSTVNVGKLDYCNDDSCRQRQYNPQKMWIESAVILEG